jgi:hypothetical protein
VSVAGGAATWSMLVVTMYASQKCSSLGGRGIHWTVSDGSTHNGRAPTCGPHLPSKHAPPLEHFGNGELPLTAVGTGLVSDNLEQLFIASKLRSIALGGGKMWTNLSIGVFRGALGVRDVPSFPGRPPPLPNEILSHPIPQGWHFSFGSSSRPSIIH